MLIQRWTEKETLDMQSCDVYCKWCSSRWYWYLWMCNNVSNTVDGTRSLQMMLLLVSSYRNGCGSHSQFSMCYQSVRVSVWKTATRSQHWYLRVIVKLKVCCLSISVIAQAFAIVCITSYLAALGVLGRVDKFISNAFSRGIHSSCWRHVRLVLWISKARVVSKNNYFSR